MSIASAIPGDKFAVPLALRGTAIPRDQGTCDHVLYLVSSPSGADPDELPLSYVPNLANDARFISRPNCQFGDGGQFYAAVPIRTRRGINIGAYCVMSQQEPPEWNDKSAAQLREISRSIMDHLELRRSSDALQIQGRMNTGIGAFLTGKHTLHSPLNGTLDATLDDIVTTPSLDNRPVKRPGILPDEHSRGNSEQPPAAICPTPPSPTVTNDTEAMNPENDSRYIFSKAANLIREVLDVEGCLFVDVSLGSYAPSPLFPSTPPADASETSVQDSSNGSSTSGDDYFVHASKDLLHTPCEVVGFSTREASSLYGEILLNNTVGVVSEGFLAKLLRRYPKGKIFNFDAIGGLQSSDSSDDDIIAKIKSGDKSSLTADCLEATQRRRRNRPYSRFNEGPLIQEAFPTARSVIFVPVRDAKRERWFSGGFLYTLTPTQPFSVEGELMFLHAFARLITSEVLNLQALRSDKTKSDILGSISHELRSPLHGVILSTDLLNNSNISMIRETPYIPLRLVAARYWIPLITF